MGSRRAGHEWSDWAYRKGWNLLSSGLDKTSSFFSTCNFCVYLGLFHGDELVQAIIINKKGFHDGNVELTRMVTKEYTQVLGGFSKLLSYTCKNYGFSEIVSYVNRAWFNGKGYKQGKWDNYNHSRE